MTVKSVEASQRQWWSIPQAIVWVVGRDLTLTMRAMTVADIEALETWEDMPAPVSPLTGEPPISRAAALGELLRAAGTGRIEIRGHYRGIGESQPVPIQSMQNPTLLDYYLEGPTIFDYFWSGASRDRWTNLWIDAAKCTAQWPGAPISAPKENVSRVHGAPMPTPEKMGTWYRQRIADHDPQQPPPSRLDDERAAKEYFERGGLKNLVRVARNKFAPITWRESGPKGRKVQARAARAAATQPGPR